MTRIAIGPNDTFLKWSAGAGAVTALALGMLLSGAAGPFALSAGLAAVAGAAYLAGLWGLRAWRVRPDGAGAPAGLLVALLVAAAVGVATLVAVVVPPLGSGPPNGVLVGLAAVLTGFVGVRVASRLLALGRPAI